MKISNLYIGVIQRIYQNDFGSSYQMISSHPERHTVLYKEEDSSSFLEDLKYGGTYPIGAHKDSGIGESFVHSSGLIPMFKTTEENKNMEINKEKVLELFNNGYERGESNEHIKNLYRV